MFDEEDRKPFKTLSSAKKGKEIIIDIFSVVESFHRVYNQDCDLYLSVMLKLCLKKQEKLKNF